MNTKNKKILILGGSSYIGQNLNNKFLKNNTLSTYKNTKIKNAVYFDFEKSKINDILKQYPNINKIIILGGIVRFSKVLKNKKKAYKINVSCIKKILSQIKSKEIIPIFFSSESVFDGKKGNYKENERPKPSFEYGFHKFEIEKYLINNFKKYKILRLAKVYDSKPSGNTLFMNWIKKIKNKETIICASDNYFNPIHIEDVCKISKKIIDSNVYGIFHLASNQRLSRKNMLDKLLKKIKTKNLSKIIIKYQSLNSFKGAENQPLDTSLNCDRTNKITGIKAKSIDFYIKKF
tara:strand:- start:9 stop:881 length:873 start_codon:yes stop_codon:yes gene_type:complete